MTKFNQKQIDIIKATIKDSIIDCELELGGLFNKYSKPDKNNVCDFSKCYQDLIKKLGSEKAIYQKSKWHFDAYDVYDHWQLTMPDYLEEKHNIKGVSFDLVIRLACEIFKEIKEN